MTSPRVQGIDFLLDGLRVTGTVVLPESGARVVDLLVAHREDDLVVRQASLHGLDGSCLGSFPEISVDLRKVFLAVPHEREEDFARRRLDRTALMLPDRRRVAVSLALPPYVARGNVHLSFGIGVSLHSLAPFFPLTQVCISLGKSKLYEGRIALVNRGLVAGFAEAKGGDQTSTQGHDGGSDYAHLAEGGNLSGAVAELK